LRIDAKGRIIDTTMALLEPGGNRHAKKKRNDEEAPSKKMASRERHRRYASERAPAPQVAPQWGLFGGGGFGGWFGTTTQYGGAFWGR